MNLDYIEKEKNIRRNEKETHSPMTKATPECCKFLWSCEKAQAIAN